MGIQAFVELYKLDFNYSIKTNFIYLPVSFLYICQTDLKNKIIYFLISLFIVFVGLLTGRTFLVAMFFSLCFLYRANSNLFIRRVILFIPFIITLLVLLFSALESLLDLERFNRINTFVFELFINYDKGGSFETSSSNVMKSMYIFPTENKTWIFGDGLLEMLDSSYYMKTDIGFIRLIFYFGLPLTILTYIMFYILYKLTIFKANLNIEKYFLFAFIMFFVILNLKGLIFPSTYLWLFFISLDAKSINVNRS